MRMIARMTMDAMALVAVISVMTMPCEAFAPCSHSISKCKAYGITTPTPPTRRYMFDWINDVLGDNNPFDNNKAKEKEEAAQKARDEEVAAKKALADRRMREREASRAAAQAAEKKSSEDMVANAKAAAEAKFAAFEADQKEKEDQEAGAAAAAAAKQAAEEAAVKAEAATAAEEEAAAAATAKQATEEAAVKAEAAAAAPAEVTEEEETAEGEALSPPMDSINDYVQEAIRSNIRVKGVVQWYNGASGYGFIKPFRTSQEEQQLIQDLRRDRWEKDTEKKSTTYSRGIFVHHTSIRTPDDTFFRKLYAMETIEMDIGFDKQDRAVAKDVTGPKGRYVKNILKQKEARDNPKKDSTDE